jgi:hypothetical protein
MRSYDEDEIEVLKAEPWQIDLLKLNPEYPHWGNYEDYMSGGSGWSAPLEQEEWGNQFALDELNELVNFYFEIRRESHQCPHCEGSGSNPETKKLSDDWYSFGNEQWIRVDSNRRFNNKAWQYHLTDVEVKALVKAGRLSDLMDAWYRFDKDTNIWRKLVNKEWQPCEEPTYPTPEAVNEWNKTGFGHDAINQWIAVRARAEHLGVYGNCEHCENGSGIIYDEPFARVGLQLWYLHPRKGCSRGVYIKNIKEEDLPSVFNYLLEARERNSDRFGKIAKTEICENAQ